MGYAGNWPCPDDPDNIMACVVKPCLGKTKGTQCLWKEACREVSPGKFKLCWGGWVGEWLLTLV